MDPILLAQLINTVGTVGLPLVVKLMEDIKAKREQTTVTPEDIKELVRLSNLTAADIYRSHGIALPPEDAKAGS